jgi:hypothetical protein
LDADETEAFLYEGKWLLRTLGELRLEGIPSLARLPCLILMYVALKGYNLATLTFDEATVQRDELAENLFSHLSRKNRTSNLTANLNKLKVAIREVGAEVPPPITLEDGRENKIYKRINIITDVEIVAAACRERDLETLENFYKGKFLNGLDENADSKGPRLDTENVAELLRGVRTKLNDLLWTCILESHEEGETLDWAWVECLYGLDMPQDAIYKEDIEELLRTNGRVITRYTNPDLEEDDFSDLQEKDERLGETKEDIVEIPREPEEDLEEDNSLENNALENVVRVEQKDLSRENQTSLSPEAVKPDATEPPTATLPTSPITTHLPDSRPRLIALALATFYALALVAGFFLTRLPREFSLELEANVTGLSFTLAEPQLVLTGVPVTELDALSVTSFRPPVTTSATGEATGGEVIEATTNTPLGFRLRAQEQFPMLVFPNDLVLPAGSQVSLRFAEGSQQRYGLELRPAQPLEIVLQEDVTLEQGGRSETRDYGRGKLLSLTPSESFELLFTPSDETVIFAPQLAIRALSFILEKPSKPGQGLLAEHSSLLSGTVQVQEKTFVLEDGDRLRLTLGEGRLERLVLNPNEMELRFQGEVLEATLNEAALVK